MPRPLPEWSTPKALGPTNTPPEWRKSPWASPDSLIAPRRWSVILRRAALMHDIGKLGVSNMILDKPGKPTDDEFDQIRKHPDYSLRILEQVEAFRHLADVAAAHHERLDGQGYHRRLDGTQIPWTARVLAVADICEAMSAKRPYRDALPWDRIQQIMAADVAKGVDPDCLAALQQWHERSHMESRVEAQMREVDRLLAEL